MAGVLIGTGVAALLGLGLGYLCIRMGGIYLSLTTLGFFRDLEDHHHQRGQMDPWNDGASSPGFFTRILKGQLLLPLSLVATILLLILIYQNHPLGNGAHLPGGFK